MQQLCHAAQVRLPIGTLFVDSGGEFDKDSGEPCSTFLVEQRVLIFMFFVLGLMRK